MNMLRSDLPVLPPNMRDLPIDSRGYPVPFFVPSIDGSHDFRVADRQKLFRCMTEKLCWICGKSLGRRLIAFTIGPMCAVNRISSEPPQHPECAEFAARACPFLIVPAMKRRSTTMTHKAPAAGIMIERNPGVALIWMTRRWRVVHEHNGVLFQIGAPIKTLWFAEGRAATRSEALEALDSGLPILLKYAQQDGPEYRAELEDNYHRTMRLLPQD